ncbi:MAG: hypothetical protein ACI81T_001739 [Bacteroidia bacterium]|jgi:hypothetical protein
MRAIYKRFLTIFLFLILLFNGFANQAQDTYLKILNDDSSPDKTLKMEDWVYLPRIRTVQIYAYSSFSNGIDKSNPPIIRLSSQRTQPLILEFDILGDDSDYYEAKIIHCNADWTVSNEVAINYLEEYNEFNLAEYEMASNTRVNYTHYKFQLPRVKFSGNYLLKIYIEGEEEDLVITRRFVVYEQKTLVGIRQNTVLGTSDYLRKQQADFTVNYSALQPLDPNNDFKVVVRQNYRWDNAITDLKPRFANLAKKTLDYNQNDLSNTFWGGNEFRHFDFGTFQRVGYNISTVIKTDTITQVVPYKDKPRNELAYNSQAIDLNGRFVIANRDFLPETQADYSEVLLELETGNPLTQEIYAVGSFSDWQIRPENKMIYQPKKGAYYNTLLLKQGAYDYIYVEKGATQNSLEGNYNRTRNIYDVIVYFRPFGARGDRAVGYGAIGE